MSAVSSERVRAGLALAADLPDGGEVTVETGGRYAGAVPVAIRIRRRGARVDLDDLGAAVRLAGRSAGWLELAQRAAALEGMNVNRAGVVFVPAVVGRDLATLALRLGAASLAVHDALLELD